MCVFVIFCPCCKRSYVTSWSNWLISFSIFLCFNKNTHYHNPCEENYLCLVAVRNDMRLLLWVEHDDVLRRVTILLEQLNILAICFCWCNCKSVVFAVFFELCPFAFHSCVCNASLYVCHHPRKKTHSQDIKSSVVKLLAWWPGCTTTLLSRSATTYDSWV